MSEEAGEVGEVLELAAVPQADAPRGSTNSSQTRSFRSLSDFMGRSCAFTATVGSREGNCRVTPSPALEVPSRSSPGRPQSGHAGDVP